MFAIAGLACVALLLLRRRR
ncbi:MAG: hypothetical protein ACXVIG_04210 [Halobacteriota archaeon]